MLKVCEFSFGLKTGFKWKFKCDESMRVFSSVQYLLLIFIVQDSCQKEPACNFYTWFKDTKDNLSAQVHLARVSRFRNHFYKNSMIPSKKKLDEVIS